MLFALTAASLPVQAYGPKTVSGRVTDPMQKPVKHARVELWDLDGKLDSSVHTNRRGQFEIRHNACGPCCLEVVPPVRTRLSAALLEDISGDENRSVIVQLKKGFVVSGRVTSSGKGLSGVIVKVYSSRHADSRPSRVHGGGAVETGRGGSFKLVLTPGDKNLVVLNNHYDKLVEQVSTTVSVTSDIDVGTIEVPGKQ